MYYNGALKCLVESEEKQTPIEVIVACCLLFIGVEFWPQKDQLPHVHMAAGLRLCQAESQRIFGSQSPFHHIRKIILALGDSIAAFYDNFGDSPATASLVTPVNLKWEVQPHFADIGDAHDYMDKLFRSIARLSMLPSVDKQSEWHQLAAIRTKIQTSQKQP